MAAGLIKRTRQIALQRDHDLVTSPTREEREATGFPSLPLIENDELVDLLREAPNDMLEPLVEFIRNKGRPTSKLEQTANYKRHAPNHQMYASEIAAEIQRYGANDFARVFRGGKGVQYSEIVRDVAEKLGVKTLSKKTRELETEIVRKIFEDACKRMPPEQQVEILRALRIQNFSVATAPVSVMAFQTVVNTAGFPAYQATVIVANGLAQSILGHGLSFTTNWVLVKGVSIMAGPLGVALAALLSANMFAGPAYRVTIPCVVQVALIRQHIQRQRRRRLGEWIIGFLIGAVIVVLLYFFLLKR